jgi:hypothetical protein
MPSPAALPELFVPSLKARQLDPAPRYAASGFLVLLLWGLTACGAGPESETPRVTTDEDVSSASSAASPDEAEGSQVDVTTDDDGWLTAPLRIEREPTGIVTITDVRVARHDSYDRFVITLAGDSLPTLDAELTRGPATFCGSGEAVDLAGEAVLTVGLNPAQAHDEAGNSTLEPRDTAPGLPALLDARLVCDFEGHVVWAFGIAHATAFRVMELSQPARIAVDIRH